MMNRQTMSTLNKLIVRMLDLAKFSPKVAMIMIMSSNRTPCLEEILSKWVAFNLNVVPWCPSGMERRHNPRCHMDSIPCIVCIRHLSHCRPLQDIAMEQMDQNGLSTGNLTFLKANLRLCSIA